MSKEILNVDVLEKEIDKVMELLKDRTYTEIRLIFGDILKGFDNENLVNWIKKAQEQKEK